MADKARVSFPIAVTFSDGELPTAAKLTAIATQARQGLSLFEYAVGDLWNQGGDSFLEGNADSPVMIPNLARYIDAPKQLSPRIPYLPNIVEYTHKLTNDLGLHDSRLPFPPTASPPSGGSWTWAGTAPLPVGSPQASKDLVQSTGQWWADTNGDLYFFDPILADWKVTYEPFVNSELGENATYNYIPDPDTDASYAFQGLKLEYKNGTDDGDGYLVYLPPRGPLNTRRIAFSPQDDTHIPTAAENLTVTPSGVNLTFWQADSVVAVEGTNAEHYRYVLPKLITDSTEWASGATLPTGLLYLYDPSGSGTIVEGLTYKAETAVTPRTWVLHVTGANLTSWISAWASTVYTDTVLKTTTHGAALYPSTGLKLITVGSSISSAFANLLTQYLNHDHALPPVLNGSGTIDGLMNKRVPHSSLSGLDCPVHPTAPQLSPSAITGDDHPQYLERHGYYASRDLHKNMMMGDLVLASIGSASTYENITSNSRMLKFGSNSAGPYMFWDYSDYFPVNGRFQIVTPDLNNSGLRISRESPVNGHYLDIKLYNTGVTANDRVLIEGGRSTVLGCWGSNGGNLELWGKNGVVRVIDAASPTYPITCTAASGGGITLGESSQVYRVATRNDTVVTTLSNPEGMIVSGDYTWNGLSHTTSATAGWVNNSYAGSYTTPKGWLTACSSTTPYIGFTLNDWPPGMLLKDISFWYAIEGGTAAELSIRVCQGYWPYIGSTTHDPLYQLCSASLAGTSGARTIDTITFTFGSPVDPVFSSTWSKGSHFLHISFTAAATATWKLVYPQIKLTYTHTAVSSWQSVS